MAIAKPSPILSSVSGAIGPVECFQNGASIRIAPRRTKCTSTTPAAISARAQHTAAIAAWHSLSATQLSAYQAATSRRQFPDRFGTPRHLSPFQFFLAWYPYCLITYPTHPDPYFDAPVSDMVSPGPLAISLAVTTTPTFEITCASGLFLGFLSWWHWQIYGPHNHPAMKPRMWRFVDNTRMWALSQDVVSLVTAAGIPIIEGAAYSVRLRLYVWRNWPSAAFTASTVCTAP